MVRRVTTGIKGLDPLMEGGFIKGASILVTGGAGTGKTIFGLQFLWDGLKKGEPGVYITLEEDVEDIREDARRFGWDFSEYEKKNLFRIVYYDPLQVNEMGINIVDDIDKIDAQRVVVDSVSIVGMMLPNEMQVRKKLISLINSVKRTGATSVLISEVLDSEEKGLSRFGVEEFVVDGVISMYYFGIGEGVSRSMMIRKMRRTNQGTNVYPIMITEKGMEVRNDE
ncbi:MAG: ATPase [Candidatus Aenigmarchaeota archaeon]|nr:ATPase [Candidatus Aenigmarchaeota archaeon]